MQEPGSTARALSAHAKHIHDVIPVPQFPFRSEACWDATQALQGNEAIEVTQRRCCKHPSRMGPQVPPPTPVRTQVSPRGHPTPPHHHGRCLHVLLLPSLIGNSQSKHPKTPPRLALYHCLSPALRPGTPRLPDKPHVHPGSFFADPPSPLGTEHVPAAGSFVLAGAAGWGQDRDRTRVALPSTSARYCWEGWELGAHAWPARTRRRPRRRSSPGTSCHFRVSRQVLLLLPVRCPLRNLHFMP